MSIVQRSESIKPNDFLWQVLEAANGKIPEQNWIALDPGETTGVCIWLAEPRTFLCQQWQTKDLGPSYDHLLRCVQEYSLGGIRYEDYKVYSHKAQDHVNNSLHTAQWIGGIQIAAYQTAIEVDCRMAVAAKTFWTDQKLEMCNCYSKGMKHARDAMRHMLTLMTFPPK